MTFGICHAYRMLRLAGVSKAFGPHRGVSNVSLEVATGEVVLLVGRNGAGKTTLLRIASGYLDPDRGTVSIDGIAMANSRSRAQARLGYLPEHAPAPTELTVRDHLTLRAHLKQAAMSRRGTRARIAAIVDEAMAATGVTCEADRRIGTLSKGFRQRVGLADALLGTPPLLMLDEPTSGMDPVQIRALRDQLALAGQGQAVLVSSHAVADLESVATRVAVVKAGTLIEIATPHDLRAKTNRGTLEDAVIALCGEAVAA